MANWDKVEANFSKMGYVIVALPIEESGREEFLAMGFDSVPTLVIPRKRPHHPIAPEWVIDFSKLYLIFAGKVGPNQTKHRPAQERIEQGIGKNVKFEHLRHRD